MMKERLILLMKEARKELSTLPDAKEFSRLSTVLYFSPYGDTLPVHLLVDIVALKDVDFEHFCEETDAFHFLEGEILGELSDNYFEIRSFLGWVSEFFSIRTTYLLPTPLQASIPKSRQLVFSSETLLNLLDQACQTGDFALWNVDRPEVDLNVGIRIDEALN